MVAPLKGDTTDDDKGKSAQCGVDHLQSTAIVPWAIVPTFIILQRP